MQDDLRSRHRQRGDFETIVVDAETEWVGRTENGRMPAKPVPLRVEQGLVLRFGKKDDVGTLGTVWPRAIGASFSYDL